MSQETDRKNGEAVAAGKLTLQAFAERGGCSRNTVNRYRTAWDTYVTAHRENAAKIGPDADLIESKLKVFGESLLLADELLPGQQLTLDIEALYDDGVDKLLFTDKLAWDTHFRQANRSSAPEAQGDANRRDAGEVIVRSLTRGAGAIKEFANSFKTLIENVRGEMDGEAADLAEARFRAEITETLDEIRADVTRALDVVASETAEPDPMIGSEVRNKLAAVKESTGALGKVRSSNYKANKNRENAIAYFTHLRSDQKAGVRS
jgi:hypothetical protein